MLSIVIPANNEADYIGACLESLLGQRNVSALIDIVVVANACTDETVAIARAFSERARDRGWRFVVLDTDGEGKTNALNMGDDAAAHPARLYLDADVVMEPDLLAGICRILSKPQPVFCGGRLKVAPAHSRITRRYAEIWTRLPFTTSPDPTGAGLYAVNAAGRRRWARFPNIVSDDTYVRLLFAPEERKTAPAGYLWPMAEGARALVRVRLRQNARVNATMKRHPYLPMNDCKPRLGVRGHLRLMLRRPVGYAVYAAIALVVRFRKPNTAWTRGR